MSDLGETFKAYKQERREKKTLNAINSEDIYFDGWRDKKEIGDRLILKIASTIKS